MLLIHAHPGFSGSKEFLSGNTSEFFRFIKFLSSGPPSARVAERRTFPATTHVPIRLTISTMARLSSFSPALPPITLRNVSCSLISGAGPEAVPPKPLIGAPSGLILE